ncbi:iron uptake transporter deferrochelatase/peroxidase subunit [Calidifontibacter terrae]
MTIERRALLRGGALSAGAAALTGTGVLGLAAADGATNPPQAPVAFHGAHQAGVLEAPQLASTFLALDVTAANRADLSALLHTLTDRARFLTAGGTPPQLGIAGPPSDSGILGPVVPGDGLTVTVGVGSTLFDDRFGLAGRKPLRLRPMDTFPDDDLDPARCGGDLVVQLAAPHRDTIVHAMRDLLRHTRGALQVRWRIDGFSNPPRPTGAPRNLLGFHDGISNPAAREADTLVWANGGGEPAWTTGGSYQVVRVIRMLVEFWDRVTISEQERIIGRRRDSGAPLSGSKLSDTPDYADDPKGQAIPLDAHIRRANPRTAQTAHERILRRAYNYDLGVDDNGNLDMGLIFTCFQRDLDRQFVATQKRLAGEQLADYISPVGGGYFFTLPGVTSTSDYYGRALLQD